MFTVVQIDTKTSRIYMWRCLAKAIRRYKLLHNDSINNPHGVGAQ